MIFLILKRLLDIDQNLKLMDVQFSLKETLTQQFIILLGGGRLNDKKGKISPLFRRKNDSLLTERLLNKYPERYLK